MDGLKLPQTPYTTNVVFICGAGVLGSAIAEQFLKDGWKVCIVSKTASKKLDGCLLLKADLYDPVQAQFAVDECVRKLGGLTVAVCCAGEAPQSRPFSAASNRGAVFKPLCGIEMNFTRSVAPYLRKRKEGAIILFTSSLTLTSSDTPTITEFLAWGNAMTGITDGLVTEMRQAAVRVTSLQLGFIQGSKFSRATRDLLGAKGLNTEMSDESNWVSPLDVAKAVKFVSDPSILNGTIWEMELNPQPMLDKNLIFTDNKRVEEMVAKLTSPAFRDNRVALVTGSGKGIGKGVALELCRAGYHIAAMTRTAKDLDVLAEECKLINPKCEVLCLPLDVTDEKALENGVLRTVEHFGTLTIVVSNAGTNRRRVAALADMKTWRDVLDVDLLAAMNLTRLSLPFLIRHAKLSALGDKPIMAFVSTRYAHHKGARMPGISPYITAKAGTNAFAKVVLEEVRGWGVGVLGK